MQRRLQLVNTRTFTHRGGKNVSNTMLTFSPYLRASRIAPRQHRTRSRAHSPRPSPLMMIARSFNKPHLIHHSSASSRASYRHPSNTSAKCLACSPPSPWAPCPHPRQIQQFRPPPPRRGRAEPGPARSGSYPIGSCSAGSSAPARAAAPREAHAGRGMHTRGTGGGWACGGGRAACRERRRPRGSWSSGAASRAVGGASACQ